SVQRVISLPLDRQREAPTFPLEGTATVGGCSFATKSFATTLIGSGRGRQLEQLQKPCRGWLNPLGHIPDEELVPSPARMTTGRRDHIAADASVVDTRHNRCPVPQARRCHVHVEAACLAGGDSGSVESSFTSGGLTDVVEPKQTFATVHVDDIEGDT